jgi:hypothetical protein
MERDELKIIEIDSIIEDFTNEDIDKMLNEDVKRINSITYTCPTSFLTCC